MNVIIVGGGFGGVKAALELSKDKNIHITLISDKPDFQYYPALYSSATGHSHLESWVPLGTIFAGIKNIHVILDTAVSIDPNKKHIVGGSGEKYQYDQCILALGVVTTYFGIKGLDTHAYGIKSAEEIKRLKQHLYEDIAQNRRLDKCYVVVGAGPTGVELAAALGSYIARLSAHYGVQSNEAPCVELIEAAPRILPKMKQQTSALVVKRLQKLGVNIQTGKTVESATADSIMINGKATGSRTLIWTAGVTNHPFYKENKQHFNLLPNGRVKVDEFMKAAPNVFVIGDNAATPFTGLAQTALHDAIFVAKNMRRKLQGKVAKKYKAVMPPVVVPVGENWAILEWRGVIISGWLGSMLRRAADFIGYNDMLPLGQALGVWHASTVMEDDYFTPQKKHLLRK